MIWSKASSRTGPTCTSKPPHETPLSKAPPTKQASRQASLLAGLLAGLAAGRRARTTQAGSLEGPYRYKYQGCTLADREPQTGETTILSYCPPAQRESVGNRSQDVQHFSSSQQALGCLLTARFPLGAQRVAAGSRGSLGSAACRCRFGPTFLLLCLLLGGRLAAPLSKLNKCAAHFLGPALHTTGQGQGEARSGQRKELITQIRALEVQEQATGGLRPGPDKPPEHCRCMPSWCQQKHSQHMVAASVDTKMLQAVNKV